MERPNAIRLWNLFRSENLGPNERVRVNIPGKATLTVLNRPYKSTPSIRVDASNKRYHIWACDADCAAKLEEMYRTFRDAGGFTYLLEPHLVSFPRFGRFARRAPMSPSSPICGYVFLAEDEFGITAAARGHWRFVHEVLRVMNEAPLEVKAPASKRRSSH